MEQIKAQTSPLIWVMLFTLLLSLSISYCGNLAIAKVDKLKIEGQMNANEMDLRLPAKTVNNLDERGVKAR